MVEKNTSILKKITPLLNMEYVQPGINLDDIEKQLTDRNIIKKIDNNNTIISDYNTAINNLSDKLGIKLNDDYEKKIEDIQQIYNTTTNNYDDNHADNNTDNGDVEVVHNTANISRSIMDDYSEDIKLKTREQIRKEHIQSVIGDSPAITHNHINDDNSSSGNTFTFEDIKNEELKYSMLAEIDSLRDNLEVEGINLSRVPDVDHNSDFDSIEKILKILRFKYDYHRCCNVAGETLVCLADFLGEIFNGERVFFGKYKPNLQGWSDQVLVKLPRMRVDTGQMVSNIMSNIGAGTGTRMWFELFTSAIMYSNMKSAQYSPHLYTNVQSNMDIDNIMKKK
jgi:hypothetical protein